MDNAANRLAMIDKDPWLEPVAGEIEYRHNLYTQRLKAIESGSGSIADYANGYRYFGFQYDHQCKGWWFREWLPGAIDVYLFGDFNGWQRTQLPLHRDKDGVWSIFLADQNYKQSLIHGSKYKMLVHGNNGWLERLPAYAMCVAQDDASKDYVGIFYAPEKPFEWLDDKFDISQCKPLLIYEAHVGMSQQREGVGTYSEFTEKILPLIKEAGYNTIQLMAVAEHPYYGSFGYHVSNFFAPSSRSGSPEELKELIRVAHTMGLGVIMDIVHAHYVKNINEGLNELDGTDHHYSLAGEAGNQPYWDSKLFDYGRGEVEHFLLSNVKFWLEEYHFDGFRFDGVTSMIYHHHGYTEFDSREKFFDDSVNRPALTYLTLANHLAHTLHPACITIAEDVSGMPGMCFPIEQGGVGFDYRLAMAIPDFWIKLLKEVPDEQWNIRQMWDMMTNRLPEVGTVAYAESHDQALVGDKTLAFRLMDRAMYTDMSRQSENIVIDRGMALHKMIRLFTIALGGGAYLNFMGNEFGHPEWIDFPRDGNNWSYQHARRQWNLATDTFLRYSYLGQFDKAMIKFIKESGILSMGYAWNQQMDEINKTMVFSHGTWVFIFNWHIDASIADYIIPVPEAGKYTIALDSDSKEFGGTGRVDDTTEFFSYPIDCTDGIRRHYIKIYNVCRTALVMGKVKD